jgi:hypothetical protein
MENPNVYSPEMAKKISNYTGAIPGQSLTTSTEEKQPWQEAPEFVNRREAEMFILEELTDKDRFISVTDMIGEGMPLDIITRAYLMDGYGRGLWDVDLMTLLIESVGFILMALAEKVGIDYELYSGDSDEEEDISSEVEIKNMNKSADIIKQGIKKVEGAGMTTMKTMNKKLTEQLDSIPQETIKEAKSLLAKNED